MVTWKDLHFADFDFSKPFRLQLEDHSVFYAEKIVRIVPKKRLVAFGVWNDKSVVAKIFFDPKRSRQHFDREINGIKKLLENNIPTPEVYLHGLSYDRRAHFILFERIFFAKSLETIWQEKENMESIFPVLSAVTTELALQHVLGVVQKDLHLNNFLIDSEKIVTLDAGQLKFYPPLLPKKESEDHLALFFSQLGLNTKNYQEELFKIYAKSRGWIVSKKDQIDLLNQVTMWRKKRWNAFKKKILRECSQFAKVKSRHFTGIYDRSYVDCHLIEFIKNPELHQIDSSKFIVKKFSRSSWFKTEGMRHWIAMNKMNLLNGIKEKPVAIIEKRVLGMKFESYLVVFKPKHQT